MRQIIIDSCPGSFHNNHLTDWRYFDLITELNDDIEDVFEDITTINANAFLISINENSVEKTRKDFSIFLNDNCT